MSDRDYFDRQFAKHIDVTQLADSFRSGWFRAECSLHDWYSQGWEPFVEDAAYEHLAADHPVPHGCT